ncbi:MAG: hypothetical protein ACP6IS_09750 [Candidatus Asgardarchaeia archaeon]
MNLKYGQITSTISYSVVTIEECKFRVIKKLSKNEEKSTKNIIISIFYISVDCVLDAFRMTRAVYNHTTHSVRSWLRDTLQ